MLNATDNEILSRVGQGTPMGDLLRQYWLPVMQSHEVGQPDGRPQRVRLLGEDLILFRDTAGTAGLLANNCPHRGASLFFGRNEEEGLRCVYHGWKFDVAGRCVDMPNEPPESNFKDKVHATAYPCAERGGVIWTYMGNRSDPPALPELEWNIIPEEQRFITMRHEACNFAQAIEGGIDSSHSGFLHSRLSATEDVERGRSQGGSEGMRYKTQDKHPRFEVVDTDYGVLIGARRDAEADSYYWRITQFLMPFFQMIPPYGESPTIGGHAWVPVDDYNTMSWSITWHPTRPLTGKELERMRAYPTGGIHVGDEGILAPTTQAWGRWMPRANASNDYELDIEAQKTVLFSGILNLALQDSGMQESMGPIYNRTQEHLGASDTGIIQMRKRLINAAILLRERGVTPTGVDSPAAYRVRSAGVVLPRSAAWVEAAQDHLTARPGVHLGSA
jgi:nitrite reductase/ring-hydroxylating ferredoxin subunit